jgi:hypothetical protein
LFHRLSLRAVLTVPGTPRRYTNSTWRHEGDQVMETFKERIGVNSIRVDAGYLSFSSTYLNVVQWAKPSCDEQVGFPSQ